MNPPQSVYLNAAGTSWPKPPAVTEAAAAVYQHAPDSWPAVFANAHQTVADFFHVATDRLLLTPSCTAALQLAIADHPWEAGDRVVCSGFEHHALHRNLIKLAERGVEVYELPRAGRNPVDLNALREILRRGVRLVAMTAACNVTGERMPIDEVIGLAHSHGALVLVDGAQIAGWWDLDLTALGADLFTFAGHKGTQAPWGIGGLYVAPGVSMSCPEAVCDVSSATEAVRKCAPMPGYCDAGSVNVAALAGLAAACDWLREPQQNSRLAQAQQLAGRLTENIRSLSKVRVHGDVAATKKMPTVAVTVDGQDPTSMAARFAKQGILCSGGFQCAPQAHRQLGTSQGGVVRFSFGPLSSAEDVDQALTVLMQLAG